MKRHVFISKPGRGWSKLNIPGSLMNSSREELCNWAYSIVKKNNYKGFLISDNAAPYPINK
ncbi:MAG: hypothetical protein JSV22_04620 [Bacteroidales bacterium]|nr:MAG: hypothetical protein JSV22_04620 [Bacteroidales bacterium]